MHVLIREDSVECVRGRRLIEPPEAGGGVLEQGDLQFFGKPELDGVVQDQLGLGRVAQVQVVVAGGQRQRVIRREEEEQGQEKEERVVLHMG